MMLILDGDIVFPADKIRLSSLDCLRGLVMFLMIGEATGIYDLLVSQGFSGSIVHAIGLQFQHHPWNGLRLWDLGQPFFMFISGAAMVFSYGKRWDCGETWRATLGHAARRFSLLFALGWVLYYVSPMEQGFPGAFLYDVLPQLACASLLAFLLIRRPFLMQFGSALGLIVLTELLYRLWPVPSFIQPFTAGHNFGTHVDFALFGQTSGEYLVAFNIVPAAAFTILGVLASRLLRSGHSKAKKMRILVGAGLSGVVLGLTLNPITPIIKRICTSSFVLVSGGLCMLALALAYWLIDVVGIRKGPSLFIIVGMNPIFIYLFTFSGGGDWLRRIAEPFTMGCSRWIGEMPAQILTSLVTWCLLYALCYWLYKRKIFFKI
jgi:predicted acyltransferase